MDEVTDTSIGLTEEEEALLDSVLREVHEEGNPPLPLNSKSLLVSESTSRFSSAIWFEAIQLQTITLAGVGGIGGYVAFLLGRLKPYRIILYDNDRVEEANLSGQMFSTNDIGIDKVDAISRTLRDYSGYYNIAAYRAKFEEHSTATDIMICGFDNMRARRDFYHSWKRHIEGKTTDAKKKCLFIDGRLAAEEFQVFCITGIDDYLMKRYEEEWLFSDYQAEETLCSYKQTSFCANMIASVMVNLFVNFTANQCNPIVDRELPFFTRYDAERMLLKTETT